MQERPDVRNNKENREQGLKTRDVRASRCGKQYVEVPQDGDRQKEVNGRVKRSQRSVQLSKDCKVTDRDLYAADVFNKNRTMKEIRKKRDQKGMKGHK